MDRMSAALDHYVIRGVTHNMPLLRDVMNEAVFRTGMYNTMYLPTTYPDGFQGAQLSGAEESNLAAIAATYSAAYDARTHEILNRADWRQTDAGPTHHRYYISIPRGVDADDKDVVTNLHASVRTHDGHVTVNVEGVEHKVEGEIDLANPVMDMTVNGHNYVTQIQERAPGKVNMIFKGSPFKMKVMGTEAAEVFQYMPEKVKMDLSTVTIAPMSGLIKSVSCEVGDMVNEGQELCVIEAMKMQNSLVAPKTGKVIAVNCAVGETVEEEAVLVELEK
jgi:propionyl-CoA carboxylase alpha chain